MNIHNVIHLTRPHQGLKTVCGETKGILFTPFKDYSTCGRCKNVVRGLSREQKEAIHRRMRDMLYRQKVTLRLNSSPRKISWK